MFKKLLLSNRDMFLVIWVVGILLVLFSPIPPMVLDLLLISNFGFALTILMLTFYVEKPVAFSTFPSLLLVATLYRLALNVAATRLILTDADAGEVIGAIGSYAVQGSYVIGLVVFFILVVVQFIVVTAGAQRVSEVSARFVLDSMPGQQMSIDADLNMGLIDQNEARRRRKELEREAAFYGSMDGASKFIKGDAIAGIIILLINIIAGWIIGVAQMGMDWMEALQTFTLLTIGDGIVTQAPALVIAVATGIIVTRSSSDRQLSQEALAQLTSVPRILLIVVVALLILLAMPGMPKWPIAVVALSAAGIWFAQRARRRQAEEEASLTEDETEAGAQESKKAPPAVEIRLSKALSESWKSLGPVLTERIEALRRENEKERGFTFPAVVFHDGPGLKANSYEVLLFGARHAQGEIYADRTLAIMGSGTTKRPEGVEIHDPAYGLPAVWIEDDAKGAALDQGLTLVDPVTVLMTHLGEVLRSEAPLLLSRAQVVSLLEAARERQAGLIEELIPSILTVSDVQRVLQNLLAEDVSIRNLDLILEALVDAGRGTKDHGELTETVRQKLSHNICHRLRQGHEQLSVLSLNPRLEARLAESIRGSDKASGLIIEPKLAEQLIRKLIPLVESMMKERRAPVLLCGPEIRRHLKTFTRRSVPRLAVVSVNEVPHSIDLASFGVVSAD